MVFLWLQLLWSLWSLPWCVTVCISVPLNMAIFHLSTLGCPQTFLPFPVTWLLHPLTHLFHFPLYQHFISSSALQTLNWPIILCRFILAAILLSCHLYLLSTSGCLWASLYHCNHPALLSTFTPSWGRMDKETMTGLFYPTVNTKRSGRLLHQSPQLFLNW